ncbi:MAG: dodecin family protein [Methyloligellaceae bacterium]|nr:MAG: dodecin domain-containing protein [Alphaproteobacteria bacterium]RMF10648.1 MAG: dodecin domain-containing protein [Alphaproteobacteria bacterium]
MAVLKVIEIMAGSEKSWKDAVNKAVEEASKTVKNIKSVWVKDQDAVVKDGKITEYRVITKITFVVED